jgi:hypothetical protein
VTVTRRGKRGIVRRFAGQAGPGFALDGAAATVVGQVMAQLTGSCC